MKGWMQPKMSEGGTVEESLTRPTETIRPRPLTAGTETIPDTNSKASIEPQGCLKKSPHTEEKEVVEVGALTLITAVCKLHNITSGNATLGIDCESFLKIFQAAEEP